MELSRAAYIRNLVEAIHRRIGTELFLKNEVEVVLTRAAASEPVTAARLHKAMLSALTHLKADHGIAGSCVQICAGFIEPKVLADVLVNAIVIPYRPVFPSPFEWKTEIALLSPIGCALMMVLKTLLAEPDRREAQTPANDVN